MKPAKPTVKLRAGFVDQYTETAVRMHTGARATRLPSLDEIDRDFDPTGDDEFDAEVAALMAEGEEAIFAGVSPSVRAMMEIYYVQDEAAIERARKKKN